MKKVLVALDGGSSAEELLRLGGISPPKASAEEMALVLLHCMDLNRLTPDGSVGLDQLLESKRLRCESYLNRQAEGLRQAGFSQVSVCLVLGGPRQGILSAAQDHQVDLILLRTHGRSGLQWLFLGSVAEGVIRRATCPVLVLPAAAEQPAIAVGDLVL
jgi:nucleotide-binding universal stress UspA family protein